jgi:hypothetical protein
MVAAKNPCLVIPAKAGIQEIYNLDTGLIRKGWAMVAKPLKRRYPCTAGVTDWIGLLGAPLCLSA